MAVTLERILTSPAAFGLTTATPVQRAICRAADGIPLGELADDPEVVQAFGGLEALAMLDASAGTGVPLEFYIIAAIRTAKSLIAAAASVRAAVTADFTGLGPGEIPRVSCVSVKLDLAKVVFDHIKGAMLTGSALRPLLADEPLKNSLMIRHPSGRLVEVMVVAGSRAGYSIAARWSAGLVLDEAPKMLGAADGTVNFDDMRSNALGRFRPGAQLFAIGSPWAPRGPLYDAVRKHFGKPCRHLVIVRAPGPVMNPSWWTPERVAELRSKPGGDMAYRTDVLGEFADMHAGWIAGAELDAVMPPGRALVIPLPDDGSMQCAAAMDPATRRNAWTLIIAGRVASEVEGSKVVVLRARQWIPTRDQPLKPAEILAEIAEELARYGLKEIHTDSWSNDALKALGEQVGIEVIEDRPTAEDQVKRYQSFKTKVLQAEIELPPDGELRADIVAVKQKTTARSVTFELPLTPDGRHCDYVPAVVLAAYLVSTSPMWIRAMAAMDAREKAEEQDDGRVVRFCVQCQTNYVGPCPKHSGKKAP